MHDHDIFEIHNNNIRLSHHEKRTLAWKILFCVLLFFSVMFFVGVMHVVFNFTDPVLSILYMVIGWLSIGMFGAGYMFRDRLPHRMSVRCKRFSFMGVEFGVWHWTRAQVYLADIFLVSLASAVTAWSLANTIPLITGGMPLDAIIPILHVPILYWPLWMEVLLAVLLVVGTVFIIIYYFRSWILGKTGDFCYFEGFKNESDRVVMDCDPNEPGCYLNEKFS